MVTVCQFCQCESLVIDVPGKWHVAVGKILNADDIGTLHTLGVRGLYAINQRIQLPVFQI